MSDSQGADFLTGGGELGALMRDRDWARTPLGAVPEWPQALKTAVRIMLTSRQPMFVWWGEELINLYNDAYKSIVGGKHPWALGQPAAVVWREIWAQVGPRAQSAILENRGTYDEALLLIMERNGYPEETYYTFSYSPVPNDEGGTGGILCANTEDTQRIVGARQLALLRELAARTGEARTIEAVCRLSAGCLETNLRDIPFALIYLQDAERHRFVLAGASGIAPGHPAAPEEVAAENGAPWPLNAVTTASAPDLLTNLNRFPNLPSGAWPSPPVRAAALPLGAVGQNGNAGVLVVGLNPYRLFDDSYEGFLSLVAGQITAAIANAQAYEDERKRAESLAELDRAKTMFFNNVSHELRTPLTLLLGPLEDAAVCTGERLQIPKHEVELMYRNGQRLLKLVNTLLDFSRIEAGRMQASYEPVDLGALTAELASVFRSAFERAGLRLASECPTETITAYVDREMWEKVVFNLLSNAFKFTFQGGVTVRLSRSGERIELEVSDTGIGISEEDLPHIFERFHRVPAARSRTYEGSGIGLALVYELVKLHGGEVTAESRPGFGTKFRITMPAGKEHLPQDRIGTPRTNVSTATEAGAYLEEAFRSLPASAQVESSEVTDLTYVSDATASGSRTAKILLVDDNSDMRDYLMRLLGGKYEILAAENGRVALDTLRDDLPDLVLSDAMMPEMDGFGLLQAIRADERTRRLPVILLSARAGEDAKVDGLGAGADDYLVKPFSARELLARVDACIKLARVRGAADAALRASESRFRRLFEANIFGVFFGVSDGSVAEANDAFLQMVGYSREDVKAGLVRWDRMTPGSFADLDRNAAEQLMQTGICRAYEKEFIRKDGSRVPVLMGAAMLGEPYHRQNTAVVFCLDLTERKRVEEQMLQTQKLESLGVLAGGVAHDFNNLLVGILGNASLALEGMDEADPNRTLLEDIMAASERAADLTKQLLAYAGKGRFMPEKVDLSALVRQIGNLIYASIPKHVQLQLDLKPGIPAVEGDPGQLQQLIMNLIINGGEAVDDHTGTVRVTTGVQRVFNGAEPRGFGSEPIPAGQYVFLEVQDTGCGMDEGTKARIFDPFFTTKFMGRGLGLAAALGIVKGHGGAVQVESTPAKGSIFRVLFPAGDQATATHTKPAHNRVIGSGLVLVVDDEDVVRRTVKSTLERHGYSVLAAENGQEAVRLFRREHERVLMVILDMNMPVMGGEEALRQLQSIQPEVRVILSSGYNEVEAVTRFQGKGLAGFIQKPYTSLQLAEKVTELAARMA
ncbi:MAG: response regulator [Bryobacteraceae bacterium]